MIATRQEVPDPIGFVALTLPVFAVLLNLAATFLVPSSLLGIATVLIAASFFIVFASVPFAGVVALRARRTSAHMMRRALVGLALGIAFSVLFVYGTWLVNEKARAIQEQLENQNAEQAEDGDTLQRPC